MGSEIYLHFQDELQINARQYN